MAKPISAPAQMLQLRKTCLGSPGAFLWSSRPPPQPQPAQLLSPSQHRRQARAATLQLKAAPTTRREEGDDGDEILKAWRRRLSSSTDDDGYIDSDDESYEDYDLLDSSSWDPATEQQWAQFLQQSGMRDCKFWDPGAVDVGLPPTQVDLNKD